MLVRVTLPIEKTVLHGNTIELWFCGGAIKFQLPSELVAFNTPPHLVCELNIQEPTANVEVLAPVGGATGEAFAVPA